MNSIVTGSKLKADFWVLATTDKLYRECLAPVKTAIIHTKATAHALVVQSLRDKFSSAIDRDLQFRSQNGNYAKALGVNVGGCKITPDIAGYSVLERSHGALKSRAPQFLDRRFRKILIPPTQMIRHVSELDPLLFPSRCK